jgi:AraC-like DNA-binding protein
MRPDAWAGAWVVAADAEQLAGHRRLVLGAPAPAGTEAAATDALDRGDVAEIGRSGLLNGACRQAWALTQLPDATPQSAVTSIVRAIESNLLSALVLSCTIERSDEDSCGDLRADMLLDRLRANYQHPITVADMASVAGLSVRQLQSVFQRTVGHSSMAALRTIRMRHAHQMLRSAVPHASTVTSIAYHCGIIHPSRFALQYRAEYGESPSETLARRG